MIPTKKIRFINRTPDYLQHRRSTLQNEDYNSISDITQNVKTGIRDLIDNSGKKLPKVNPNVFTELEMIDKTQKKLVSGISAFLESEKLLAEKMAMRKNNVASFGARRVQQIEEEEQKLNAIPNIINYLMDKEHKKEQDKEFNNREIVMKLKQETFEASVKVSRLGKTKQWKPNRHSFLSGRKSKMLFN